MKRSNRKHKLHEQPKILGKTDIHSNTINARRHGVTSPHVATRAKLAKRSPHRRLRDGRTGRNKLQRIGQGLVRVLHQTTRLLREARVQRRLPGVDERRQDRDEHHIESNVPSNGQVRGCLGRVGADEYSQGYSREQVWV